MTDSKMEETQKEVASPTKESPSANSSASPKSSPTKKDIDIATQALNHFAQGKRHLLVQDISSAVNSLQAASQLLAEHYGETAPECADAYFYYGKALLELARIENGVLGNALDGVPESEDENNSQVEDPEKLTEEEKDMVSEIVGDALEENFTESEEKQKPTKDCSATNHKESLNSETDKGDENVVSGTKSTKDGEEVDICRSDEQGNEKEAEEKMDTEEVIKDVKKDKESEVEAVITESKATSEGPTLQKDKESTTTEDESTEDEDNEDKDDESQDDAEGEASQEEGDEEAAKENGEASDEPEGEKTEESEEEDVSNLQLAWEMLELSKVIYSKQLESNPSMNLKIAQVHLALGEVGMESENYAQSVEDFQQCLNIQTKELKDDDRCLAESHYQMGVAHSFADDFDKAIESFKSAANVIESRISNLQIQQKEKESWTEEQKKKDAAEKKDPFYTEAAEIEELNSLLPEIKEKIVDMEEMKKDSKEKLQKIKEATFASVLGGSRSNGASTSGETSTGFPAASSLPSSETISAKPATNISHLIRKKRKPEDEPEKEDTKKAKGENGEEMKTVTSLNGKEENGSPSEETSNSKDVQMKELPEVSTEVSEKKTEVAS